MRLLALIAALSVVVFASVNPSDPCATKQIYREFNLTVTTQDDIDAISSCTKIGSNLVIDKNFPGEAKFPNIRTIDGGIIVGDVDALSQGGRNAVDVETSALTSLVFPSLVKVHTLQILGMRDLITLDFPAIKEISSEMDLINLPSLVTWTGFDTLNHSAYTYIINTGLSELLWNSSDSRNPTTGTIYISNNTALDLIVLSNPNSVDQLTVNGNGNTKISLGIETVRGLTITGCSGYSPGPYGLGDGFNNLENITGLYTPDGFIRIWNNTFETIQLMQLNKVNGSVEIHDNPKLVNISMAGLWEIDGELDITNNDDLKIIKASDFNHLEKVNGNVNFTGSFDQLDLNDRLNVSYSFEIRATGNVSCSEYDTKYKMGYFAYGGESRYGCAANGATLVYESESSSGSNNSSSGRKKHGISRAAFWALVIAIPVPFGLAFWGTLIWWLCRKQRKKESMGINGQAKASIPPSNAAPMNYYGAPLATGNGSQPPKPNGGILKRELSATAGVQNIRGDQASSLTIGERNGMLSTHSSISRDSRNTSDLERREEDLLERERIVEEMERERRAEELNARERALMEREREIQAWNHKRNSGPLP